MGKQNAASVGAWIDEHAADQNTLIWRLGKDTQRICSDYGQALHVWHPQLGQGDLYRDLPKDVVLTFSAAVKGGSRGSYVRRGSSSMTQDTRHMLISCFIRARPSLSQIALEPRGRLIDIGFREGPGDAPDQSACP